MASSESDPKSEAGGTTELTVLIVEDEDPIRNLYADWLKDSYDVRTATVATEALEKFDSDVDITLLDRDLPEGSGRAILEKIQSHEYDCQTVMITGVDLDIDAADMEFDEYLTKPIEKDQLHDVIDAMRARSVYDDLTKEYFAVSTKEARLRAELQKPDIHPEYTQVKERQKILKSQLEDSLGTLDDTGDGPFDDLSEGVFHDLEQDN